MPTGHRGALEEGIQPQPPDPAPGTPAGASGLGGEGPAKAPGGAGEGAGPAGSAARYATSCTPGGPSHMAGSTCGDWAWWGPAVRRHTGQGDCPGSTTTSCGT